ncbi:hypothetical protein AAY473_012817 [Plecturocebus cupreus]
MPRAILKDPHDASGLPRRCGACVSSKTVPAGISRYRQPVCRGAALSPRDFPAESRTPQPQELPATVGCLREKARTAEPSALDLAGLFVTLSLQGAVQDPAGLFVTLSLQGAVLADQKIPRQSSPTGRQCGCLGRHGCFAGAPARRFSTQNPLVCVPF